MYVGLQVAHTESPTRACLLRPKQPVTLVIGSRDYANLPVFDFEVAVLSLLSMTGFQGRSQK